MLGLKLHTRAVNLEMQTDISSWCRVRDVNLRRSTVADVNCSRLCIMDDSRGFLMLYSYSVRLANEKFTETVSEVNMNAW